MISERAFASSFSEFWARLLPLLTPSMVHIIGAGFEAPLTDPLGNPIDPVPKSPDVRDYTIVAEFAFFLARTSVEAGLSVIEVFQDGAHCSSAEKLALDVLMRYEKRKVEVVSQLSTAELEEGLALAKNYEVFFGCVAGVEDVEFCPYIPGAGFIAACEADISIGNTLFEVKTVDRNIAGKDIRQLIVYLALQAASGTRRWNYAGFFNPRRAVYHKFEVEELVARMSGGRSSGEVFHELIDFTCTSDVQLDQAF